MCSFIEEKVLGRGPAPGTGVIRLHLSRVWNAACWSAHDRWSAYLPAGDSPAVLCFVSKFFASFYLFLYFFLCFSPVFIVEIRCSISCVVISFLSFVLGFYVIVDFFSALAICRSCLHFFDKGSFKIPSEKFAQGLASRSGSVSFGYRKNRSNSIKSHFRRRRR